MADNRHLAKIVALQKLVQRNRQRRRLQLTTLASLIMKRRRLLQLCMTALLLTLNASKNRTAINRSCRRLQRNGGWWDVVWNTYTDARFKKTFRINRATFLYILDKIRHMLERKTVAEEPISPEQRLAVCLYRFGRGDYFYTISQMTGLGTSTICTIVSEVSQAIVDCLWDQEVASLMPKSEADLCKKMHEMEEAWQFPCCWSAVDGCHIPIKCPAGGLESSKEYHNFKNFYSVILMAMVDSKYRFIWGSCGFPGNSHDSIIFQSTDIWTSIMENEAILKIGKEIEGVHIPALILADSAFPLKCWMLKPYGNAVLTAKQRYFNYRLSRARMVTEGAYGQLKGRWRILHRKCESSAKEVKIITLACVILHNICLSQNDQLPRYWDITTDLKTNEEIREMLDMTKAKKVKDSEKEAIKIRNALADRFWKEKVEAEKM